MNDNSNYGIVKVITYNLLYEVSHKSKNIEMVLRDLLQYEIGDIIGFQEI